MSSSLAAKKTPNFKKSTLSGFSEIATRLRQIAPILSFGFSIDKPLDQNEKSLVTTIEVLLTEAETLQSKVKEQSDRIAYLEELATTDELTGIFNRRGFEIELHQVLARADRHDEEGVLVYVDLDGFKPVNDTYGHAAGDAVLRRVAKVLKDNTRDMDVVGRLGGDEFAVILVGTTREDGLDRAETLNRALNNSVINWDERLISLRASFGMQSYRAGDIAGPLLVSADQAMYQIKRIKESKSRRKSGSAAGLHAGLDRRSEANAV